MKVVIIGAGKVGYTLAESLVEEKNDVIVIDKNINALEKVEGSLDVMCIKGNGVSANINRSTVFKFFIISTYS